MASLDSEIKVQRLFPVFHLAGCVAPISWCQCQGFGEFPLVLSVCDQGTDVTAGVSPSQLSEWLCEQRSNRSNSIVRE